MPRVFHTVCFAVTRVLCNVGLRHVELYDVYMRCRVLMRRCFRVMSVLRGKGSM